MTTVLTQLRDGNLPPLLEAREWWLAPADPNNEEHINSNEPADQKWIHSLNLHAAQEYQFQFLVDQWRTERGVSSSTTAMLESPAYRGIIDMGSSVIPLILRQLEKEGDNPDHWGWALHVLTGEDPVPPEAAGDTVQIAAAWLAWGRTRYAW